MTAWSAARAGEEHFNMAQWVGIKQQIGLSLVEAFGRELGSLIFLIFKLPRNETARLSRSTKRGRVLLAKA